MKAGLRIAGMLAALAVLGGCVPQPVRQAPAPPPPPPAPPPPPVALAPDWQDWPVTPGTWSYGRDAGGSTARYGAQLWLHCDLATHGVTIGRDGVALPPGGSVMMTLRTSYGVLQWPAQRASGATAATRTATDSGLDWIAFSRGRFTVELPGMPALVAPGWAELSRVIEDCRG